MQRTEDINRINARVESVYEEDEEYEEFEADNDIDNQIVDRAKIPVVIVQVIICLVFICTVIAIRELLPKLYNDLIAEYNEVIEQTMMIRDGEVVIVPEDKIW